MYVKHKQGNQSHNELLLNNLFDAQHYYGWLNAYLATQSNNTTAQRLALKHYLMGLSDRYLQAALLTVAKQPVIDLFTGAEKTTLRHQFNTLLQQHNHRHISILLAQHNHHHVSTLLAQQDHHYDHRRNNGLLVSGLQRLK